MIEWKAKKEGGVEMRVSSHEDPLSPAPGAEQETVQFSAKSNTLWLLAALAFLAIYGAILAFLTKCLDLA
jgi:hypothetical protein